MDPATASGAWKALAWLKSTKEWFKATVLGAALVMATLYGANAIANDEDSRVMYNNRKAISRTEAKVDKQQKQLDRMEDKLDRLIIKLIPEGK